jgi:hypothetical protein
MSFNMSLTAMFDGYEALPSSSETVGSKDAPPLCAVDERVLSTLQFLGDRWANWRVIDFSYENWKALTHRAISSMLRLRKGRLRESIRFFSELMISTPTQFVVEDR